MNRYGGDYNRGWGSGYDSEHRHWGSNPRYDRGYGFRGEGRQPYDRGFSGHGRHDSRYDSNWRRGGYQNEGYGGGQYGMNRGRQQASQDWEAQQRELMMRRRPVSPWGPNVPGQDFGYSLGYGIGAGRYFHK